MSDDARPAKPAFISFGKWSEALTVHPGQRPIQFFLKSSSRSVHGFSPRR
jgi:hypothetical protein